MGRVISRRVITTDTSPPRVECAVQRQLNSRVADSVAERAAHQLAGAFDGVHSTQVLFPILARPT